MARRAINSENDFPTQWLTVCSFFSHELPPPKTTCFGQKQIVLGKNKSSVSGFVSQGNCESEVPESLKRKIPSSHAPLRPLLPYQCLLLADEQLLMLDATRLWLDGVYVRLTEPRNATFGGFVELWGSSTKLWMTGVTLQACIYIYRCSVKDFCDCAVVPFELLWS